ncbi:MAG: glycosyltransferase family 9 protein [Methylacidiphilales bacterium]|nr:glycosyltransferase family 9 protein [Candidatus Methylacidiphilales bacterium]MDW8349033.1 glycosyltransferase family 9 protein [Verrucomicrobiae bacterium]
MPLRILAIQIQQPGDAILTTPALRCLINQGHEVHLLAQPLSAQLLAHFPGLHSIEAIPRSQLPRLTDFHRALRYLTKKPFDRTYIFTQINDRNLIWALLSRARERIAPRRDRIPPWIPRRAFTWIEKLPPSYHEVAQHLHIIGLSPSEAPKYRLEYYPPPTALEKAHHILSQHKIQPHTHLHIHLTARWPSKCWPHFHMIALLQMLQQKQPHLPLFLTTGPAPHELDYARKIITHFPNLPHAFGTLKVNELGALIALSRAFFGMDSMPMHLAAALQIPGIALFGKTNPHNFGPWQSPITVFTSDCSCNASASVNHLCRPHPLCLKNIHPQKIAEKLISIY